MIEAVAPQQTIDDANTEKSSEPKESKTCEEAQASKNSTSFTTETHESKIDLSHFASPNNESPNSSGITVEIKKPIFEKADIMMTKTVETKVNIVSILEKNEVEKVATKTEETVPTKVEEASTNKKGKKKNKKNKNVTPPPEEAKTEENVVVNTDTKIEIKKEDVESPAVAAADITDAHEPATATTEMKINVEPSIISTIVQESTITTQIETTNESTINNETIVISSVINTTDSTALLDESAKVTQSESVELDVKTEIPIEISAPELIDAAVTKPTYEANKNIEVIEFNKSPTDVIVKAPEVKLTIDAVEAKKPEENEKKAKKDKKKSDKLLIKSSVSCFSCKSKKAKKDDKLKKKQEEAEQNVPTITEAPKVCPIIPKEESEQKTAQMIQIKANEKLTDKNCFHGLDPLPSTSTDKTIDIPSICSVEIQKPQVISQTNIEACDGTSIAFYKEVVEQTPSLVGATSIEIMQVPSLNPIEIQSQSQTIAEQPLVVESKELQITDIKISSTAEQEQPTISVEIIEPAKVLLDLHDKIELSLKPETQGKILSNDIVVLPEPPKIEIKTPTPATVELAAPKVNVDKIEEKDSPKAKKSKKEKKSSNVSCFSCKKQKSKDIKLETIAAPTVKPSEVQVKLEAETEKEHENKTRTAVALPNIPAENWAIGLDRNENDPILNKEPVNSVIETPAQIVVNVDMPSIIEVIGPTAIIEKDSEEKIKEEIKITPVKSESEPKVDKSVELISGAHIVIDRQPDHAVIPIVVNENLPKAQVKESVDAAPSTTDGKKDQKTDKKKSKDKKSKKTSIIDMPLINILTPKKNKNNLEVNVKTKTTEQPQSVKETAKTQQTNEVIDINKGGALDAPFKPSDLPELKIETLTVDQSADALKCNIDPIDTIKKLISEPKEVENTLNASIIIESPIGEQIPVEVPTTIEAPIVVEINTDSIEINEASIKREAELVLNEVEEKTTEIEDKIAEITGEIQQNLTELEKEDKTIETSIIETSVTLIEGETKNQIIEFQKKFNSEIVTETEINKFTQVLNEIHASENKESSSQINLVKIEIPEIKTEDNHIKILERIPDVVVLPTLDDSKKDVKIETKKDTIVETPAVELPKSSKKDSKKDAKNFETKIKSKKGTSCIDMPLINILVPKSGKKSSQKDKNKKSDFSKEKKEIMGTETNISTNIPANTQNDSQKTIEIKPLEIKVDHQDFFKGLDPECITKTDKYPTISPSKSSIVNEPVLEQEQKQKVELNLIIVPALVEEPKKIEDKAPVNEVILVEQNVKTIDLPNVIDVIAESKYKSVKVETWTTDPLPHVVIGTHKLGSTDEPKAVIKSPSIKETQTPTITVKKEAETPKKETKKKEKKEKTSDDGAKVSCFSCKSKKAKKEIKSVEDKPIEPVQAPIVVEKKIEDKGSKQDLTLQLKNLDAPYVESANIDVQVETSILNAGELTKKLEEIKDTKIATIELKSEPTTIETKQIETAQDEKTSVLATIVKEASCINETLINEEIQLVSNSIIEKIESAAIAEAINDVELKQDAEIKITTTEVDISASKPAYEANKNVEIIEFNKPSIETIVKSPEEKPIVVVEDKKIEEISKSKQAKKEKKDKKSDKLLIKSSISCFSCKSKKAKKEAKQKLDGDKSPSEEPVVKITVNPDDNINSNDIISPQICKDSLNFDSFKGLDKPSLSECIHISDHQSFLDVKIEETKSETQEIQPIAFEITPKEPEITIEEKIQTEFNEKLSSVSQKLEMESNFTEISSHIQTIVPQLQSDQEKVPEISIQTDAKLLNSPEIDNLPKKLSDDIVVLPDPNLRETIKAPTVDPITKTDANKSISATEEPSNKKKLNKSSSKASCFKCKSSKNKKSDKEKPEVEANPSTVPWVKKQVVVDEKSMEAAIELSTSASRPQLDIKSIELPSPVTESVKLLQQPPKKPPRGHMDTTLMNIDISSLPLEVANEVTNEAHVDQTNVSNISTLEIQPVIATPQVPSSDVVQLNATAAQATKPEVKLEAKVPSIKRDKARKTTIIDKPLIDILIPKNNKKKSKSKDDSKSKSAASAVVGTSPQNLAPTIEITDTSIKEKINIDHANLFKGLDPECITKTDKYPTTSAECQVKIENKDKAEEIKPTILVKEESKPANESEVKVEQGQVKTVDLPKIIDIVAQNSSSDYQYKSVKVDTWNTDPLPHVIIGAHKIGSEEKTVQKQQAAEPSVAKKVDAANSSITSALYVKLLSDSEKKLLKSKRKDAIKHFKNQLDYKFEDNKKDKTKEKLINKLFETCLEIIIKQKKHKDTAKNLTYVELRKKLDKFANTTTKSKLLDTTEIDKCVDQLRLEIEGNTFFETLKTGKDVKSQKLDEDSNVTKNKATATISSKLNDDDSKLDISMIAEKYKAATAATLNKQKSSSTDKVDKVDFTKHEFPPAVMRRFPSLTWREANERARILFYKGRVPSIHYNEKRDSFRVSMITQIISQTDGKEKTAEIPVSDDDVRRLLNSCGLYWNGESISLLNKSDEIFSSAQQEAFDFIQMINNANNKMFNQPLQPESENQTINAPVQEAKLTFVH